MSDSKRRCCDGFLRGGGISADAIVSGGMRETMDCWDGKEVRLPVLPLVLPEEKMRLR